MNAELAQFGVFRSKSRDGVFEDIFDSVGPLGEQVLARRKQIVVYGKRLWVTTPEDLFLLKAFSDRTRDFDDLVGIASVKRLSLDAEYIERWAKLLDESIGSDEVSERVTRALDEGKRRSRR
jgi:predicted nucleotidyltransferase